jgi:urate oxidase
VPSKLGPHSYGKSRIRLTKVKRLPDRHELVELTVNITLHGAPFRRSYTHGDNTGLIATDSMRNTVYVLAKDHPIDSPDAFALHLAEHFVITYPHVQSAHVGIEQHGWRRIEVGGAPHPTAFASAGNEVRRAGASVSRDGHFPRLPSGFPASLTAGLDNLLVLKTTDSAFTGFVRDEYTTLPETTDRILATNVAAGWTYNHPRLDFNAAFDRARATLLTTFANHKSLAVQQTLYDMGDAVLAADPDVFDIHIRMPNKHRVPFNFEPFNKEFANDVYITTDEPSGEISASIQRE